MMSLLMLILTVYNHFIYSSRVQPQQIGSESFEKDYQKSRQNGSKYIEFRSKLRPIYVYSSFLYRTYDWIVCIQTETLVSLHLRADWAVYEYSTGTSQLVNMNRDG